MPGTFLYEYFSDKCENFDKIFTDNCEENGCKLTGIPQESIILDGDNIERCFSSQQLSNSADRIIISETDDNNLDILVCELSRGKRSPQVIENKIINTSNQIVDIIKNSDFKINNFKCCYVGQYDNRYKKLMRRKSPAINIDGINLKNIMIKRVNCGSDFFNVT